MAKKRSEGGARSIFDLFSWAVGWKETEQSPLVNLPLDEIAVDARQPRRYFAQDDLERLARSIRANGVIEPVLVHKLSDGRYQLIAGERRLRAARLAGSEEIPALVSALNRESDVKKFQLIENLMRKDLNPVEETCAYLDLIAVRLSRSSQWADLITASGLAQRRNLASELLRNLAKESSAKGNKATEAKRAALVKTVSNIFDEIGHLTWREFVESRLSALAMPPDVMSALGEGLISYEHARLLKTVVKRSFGLQAEKEREKFLAWIKRSHPTAEQLRARIAGRKKELNAQKIASASTVPSTRLNQAAKRIRSIKNKQDSLPDNLKAKLEKTLANLESLVEELEKAVGRKL